MKRLPLLLLLILPLTALAQPEGKPLGLGLTAGSPTGISARYFLGKAASLHGVLGWRGGDDGAIFFQGDYLLHAPQLKDLEFGTLHAFYGGGASLLLADNPGLGVQGTAGLTVYLKELPLEISLHLSPGINLVPDTDFRVGSGLGVRYYF